MYENVAKQYYGYRLRRDVIGEFWTNTTIDYFSGLVLYIFKNANKALKFVEKFKEPLLMHWNKEIDTAQLGVIIRLVVKKKYTVEDAITAVLNDEY